MGFVFLRRVDERELLKLAGLRHLCREDEFLVLLNPSFTIENLFTRHLLHLEHMVQKPLAQCLDPETLEIPLEEMVSEFLQPEQNEMLRSAPLSKGQALDYQRFEFLCHDRLHVPGTLPTKRSNLIHLNDTPLRLGDALFVLLLYLAVELKRGEGGWVDKITLWEKGLVSSPDSYQAYSNLRNTLTGSMLKKDAAAFIQNDGSKRYRISTHPDCITYDKAKLLDHPDQRVKSLVRELP